MNTRLCPGSSPLGPLPPRYGPSSAPRDHSTIAGPRLALVDDDASTREAAASYFSAVGFETESFADAASAIARHTRNPFAAFVVDWSLETATSEHLLRQLHGALGSPTPLLFLLSANDPRAGTPAAARMAATIADCRVEYRQKPYRPAHLALELAEHLRAAARAPN